MPIGLASNDSYTTLSAMITPAIFLTANASLIISTSNRVSRVVDRIRVLSDLADRIGRGVSELDFTAERMEHVNVQLDHLEWRSDRLRSAMTALYLALSSFVGTSLTLAIDDWLKYKLGAVANASGRGGSRARCSSQASIWYARRSRHWAATGGRFSFTASSASGGGRRTLSGPARKT